ncbi:MAG TPA: thiamine pyrophosphate-binding protein [Candidatus Dormibacteraeota bacterium]|nr:thiamine pyrophosphate-binding protein [Candidatus Dormibacteraeota bacterium]
MNGAEAFVATLRSWEVDTFFGLPGSTEAPLLEALRADGSIRYVLALHEGVAVALADGYARASGRPGVVGLHTSVGTMNGMSQLFNSSRDGIPVVMTAGHKDRAVLAEDGFCAFPDLPSLLRPFTKSAWQSLSAEMVGADLSRALLAATAPPRGPAFLAVPEDLLGAQLTTPLDPASLPSLRHRTGLPAPGPGELAAVAQRLRTARKPVLVLGTEAASGGAAAVELAAEVGLAVLAADLTDLVTFSYPDADPHYLGVYGDDPAVLEGCDLVVAVGGRVFFPFSNRLRPKLPPGAALVHIHPDPLQLGRRLATDIGIVGEPKAVLEALRDECRRIPSPGATEDRELALARLREAREAAIASELEHARGGQPAGVVEVLAELSRVLPQGTILVDEAVRASRAVFRHVGVPEAGEIWRSTGGALGWGLPAAIGAKLARPDRPVVLLVGDGSLHFSIQALWTAVAQDAPVVVVVLDNGGYLAVKRAIENMLAVAHDPRVHPGTELPGIDHAAAARAYGAHAVLAHTAPEAAAAVEAGLAGNRVEVVTLPVAELRP